MRINSQDYDERGARVREESVDGVQHTQHFPLLHTVQTIHHYDQPGLLTRESIQTFDHFMQEIDFLLDSLEVSCK